MNLKSVRLEIDELCKNLHISNYKFSEVRKDQWQSILENIEERFLIKTYYTEKGFHWAWNRLKEPTYSVGFVNPTYKHFEYFNQEEYIWFIVEDFNEKMWVYEGESKAIFNQIIPELFLLKEYYLVSKKYKWLYCENHHGIACLSGKEIIDIMKLFVDENIEVIIR